MKTRRFGLLAFFTISMTLVVWSIIAPGKQAQADSRLNSPAAIADLPAHLPLDTPTVKMAYTTDITFTPSITAFLPLINRFFPEPTGTITGQITYQGAPTAGISVTLFLWYNPTTYIRFRTATSQANGTYQFSDVPKLTDYYYRVLYENLTRSAAYARGCSGAPIFSFAAGAAAPGGSFEISDITLLSPAAGTTISEPYVFQWARRATQSDNYILYIDGQSIYWDSGHLGYVDQYTLTSLTGTNLATGFPNTWSIGVKHPDGSGCSSRTERTVIFTNTSLVQFPLPTLLHQ